MTIEVRQVLIKSSVDEGDRPARAEGGHDAAASDEHDTEQVRHELLAECKAWLFEKLQNQHER